MKIDMKIENHGIINQGDTIYCNVNQNNLIQELTILKETVRDETEKTLIKEAILALQKNQKKEARSFLKSLTDCTKAIMEELSLGLIVEFLKDSLF